MPVALTSHPNKVQPIGNGYEFGFMLSSSGELGEIFSIGYRLFDVLDVPVTDIEQIPYTGTEQFADFNSDIAPYIYTTIQQPSDSPFLELDTNFQREFQLLFGTIRFDPTTCAVNTAGVSGSSKSYGSYLAINSAFQWWEDYSLLSSGEIVPLTDRVSGSFLNLFESYNSVAIDQKCFMHIYRQQGAGNIIVARTNFDSEGNALTTDVVSGAAMGAHIYDCSPINSVFEDKNVSAYRIDIRKSTFEPVSVYDFIIEDCAATDTQFNELHWIEPKGSQASLVFDTITIGVNSVGRSKYDQGLPRGLTIAQRGLNYGLSRKDVRAEERITMTRIIKNQEGLENFLKGLFASQEHYIRYPTKTGETMAKFVLDDGSYEVYNADNLLLTVAGTIHLPINNIP